ncbi:hypothetical protein [Roseiterribacter gracilis]|uniref:DUF4136 domain-containing protein n=1 Tax=Roseiterribacter gracilis TaxID=2812848 RepID=A0A8S8XAJ8_9PROT|nr:hypothetical protein TMPK1_04030 [Rhodospirillales bacterium TMPK1]
MRRPIAHAVVFALGGVLSGCASLQPLAPVYQDAVFVDRWWMQDAQTGRKADVDYFIRAIPDPAKANGVMLQEVLRRNDWGSSRLRWIKGVCPSAGPVFFRLLNHQSDQVEARGNGANTNLLREEFRAELEAVLAPCWTEQEGT